MVNTKNDPRPRRHVTYPEWLSMPAAERRAVLDEGMTTFEPPRDNAADVCDLCGHAKGEHPTSAYESAIRPWDRCHCSRYIVSDPPRATLADRENREQGLGLPSPYLVAAVVAHEIIEENRRTTDEALDKWSQPPTNECTAKCGRFWHTAYLATVCCANRNSRAIRISNPLDIPLGGPVLGEDRHASAMFDGDEPPEEPRVDVAEELRRVTAERDEAIAVLDRAIDSNRLLQAQLDEALATIARMQEGGAL